jgi:hypothetical protein
LAHSRAPIKRVEYTHTLGSQKTLGQPPQVSKTTLELLADSTGTFDSYPKKGAPPNCPPFAYGGVRDMMGTLPRDQIIVGMILFSFALGMVFRILYLARSLKKRNCQVRSHHRWRIG